MVQSSSWWSKQRTYQQALNRYPQYWNCKCDPCFKRVSTCGARWFWNPWDTQLVQNILDNAVLGLPANPKPRGSGRNLGWANLGPATFRFSKHQLPSPVWRDFLFRVVIRLWINTYDCHVWGDEDQLTSYLDVHQGYRVLTHSPMKISSPMPFLSLATPCPGLRLRSSYPWDASKPRTSTGTLR